MNCDTLIIKAGDKLETLSGIDGDYDTWITAGLGAAYGTTAVVAVHLGEALPEPGDCGRAIVTGSAAMVSDREPWSETTAAWLHRAVTAGVPVLGICYGHQLLAHALGGTVGDNPRGLEVGTVAVERLAAGGNDLFGATMPTLFSANMSHRQSVLELPPGAIPLARSAREPCAAFAVAPRAWGVQFHPEFDGVVTRHYVDRFRDGLSAQGDDPERLAAACRDTPESHALLQRFAML